MQGLVLAKRIIDASNSFEQAVVKPRLNSCIAVQCTSSLSTAACQRCIQWNLFVQSLTETGATTTDRTATR